MSNCAVYENFVWPSDQQHLVCEVRLDRQGGHVPQARRACCRALQRREHATFLGSAGQEKPVSSLTPAILPACRSQTVLTPCTNPSDAASMIPSPKATSFASESSSHPVTPHVVVIHNHNASERGRHQHPYHPYPGSQHQRHFYEEVHAHNNTALVLGTLVTVSLCLLGVLNAFRRRRALENTDAQSYRIEVHGADGQPLPRRPFQAFSSRPRRLLDTPTEEALDEGRHSGATLT